jgi:hypothetical protein
VNVAISRSQAKQIASEQLNRLGYSVEEYQFSLSFSSDSQAEYYLQRTLGVQDFNSRLADEKWPIYFWSARWFKPLEKEEFRVSGWVVVLTLAVPLMPGLYVAIHRYLRKEPPIPETLTLSPLGPSDLTQLSMLPVIADWPALRNQANRIMYCLRAGTEIIGFVTGFIDDKKLGYVDGVYITPKWRRQYWATTLLDVIHEELKQCGASEVRIIVKPNEIRTRSFLHNLFWRTGIEILTKDESAQTFRSAIKTLFNDLKKEKPSDSELEIPRNLI